MSRDVAIVRSNPRPSVSPESSAESPFAIVDPGVTEVLPTPELDANTGTEQQPSAAPALPPVVTTAGNSESDSGPAASNAEIATEPTSEALDEQLESELPVEEERSLADLIAEARKAEKPKRAWIPTHTPGFVPIQFAQPIAEHSNPYGREIGGMLPNFEFSRSQSGGTHTVPTRNEGSFA